ncbi:hypothetical protein NMY22_g19934 [Coprinellus aureogranulatus]|nr:hypothetical protein NMY22_g19934 [Coprinellus aureogranulatus]
MTYELPRVLTFCAYLDLETLALASNQMSPFHPCDPYHSSPTGTPMCNSQPSSTRLPNTFATFPRIVFAPMRSHILWSCSNRIPNARRRLPPALHTFRSPPLLSDAKHASVWLALRKIASTIEDRRITTDMHKTTIHVHLLVTIIDVHRDGDGES